REHAPRGPRGGGVRRGGPPPATGNFIGTGAADPASTNVTMTLTNPVSYVGFAWGTSDPANEVDVYNGSTLLGSFFGNQSFNFGTIYFDIHADSREAITKLVLSFNLCCFETDNYSAIPTRFIDRHIESSKIGHAALLLLMLEAADADLVSPSA